MHPPNVIAGIDIGGTNTLAGIVDIDGTCLTKAGFRTSHYPSPDEFGSTLAELVRELCNTLPFNAELLGIGIAAPAANSRTGAIQNAANLPWKSIDIVGIMKRFFDIPVDLTNDGNAAALGEMEYGAARGMNNFVVLTLGTGLGAGIVADARLLEGENGCAGEIGHVIIEPEGRSCGCGRRGCAETYVSASGLRRTVFALLGQTTAGSALRGFAFSELSAERIAEAARLGDPIACEAFASTGRHLGRLVANVVATFDPEAVVLSGGLLNAGDLIFEPTRRAFEECCLNLNRRKISLLRSQLNDGEAAILGASALVRNDTRVRQRESMEPIEPRNQA